MFQQAVNLSSSISTLTGESAEMLFSLRIITVLYLMSSKQHIVIAMVFGVGRLF